MIPFNRPYSTGKEIQFISEAITLHKHSSGNGYFTKKCQSFFEERYGFQKCLLTMLSIASTFASMELSLIQERLNSGRAKYIRDGGTLGRKVGSTKDEAKLLNEHADIVKFIRQGQSVRNTMKLTGKSSGTVQKVKKLLA
jgi:hypothetical protein